MPPSHIRQSDPIHACSRTSMDQQACAVSFGRTCVPDKNIVEFHIVSDSGFGLKENHSSMTYNERDISLKEMDRGYAAGRDRDYQLLQP